ncbi:DNA topoisomerase 2-binding protein 1-B isoform X3 [Mycetomoellerius zeteki]|uniref:DNA topoisomerase 2-binding protein 1-B isoform X3 n=1 Tax=Mycetomoellerius zeteki TaxID=64791 RepID=UPI00084E91DF|nr:PREDICTED: DNA topoisomerase 2-binding protein 1-B isoform X3 [Trachymyrmex zeteki]
MTTQESTIECDVNIYFIVPSHLESEDDCSEKTWQAFNKCNELSLRPEWVSEQFCYNMKPQKNDVFVIEEFKGEVFEKLKNFKCSRIVSPKCLLICFLNGESIPEGRSPIYTTSMRKMCICTSGFNTETKDWIQQRVEYMGGFFTKQLRGSVTHLIADSVMSAKYERAIEMEIPIMTKEWIEAVWKANLKEIIKADDKIFDKYKCPVFMNLIVTSTNIQRRQKEEIKRLIHQHGGIFMGPLDGTKVRVVLATKNGPLSDKLKYAMENDIACLTLDWVYESIKIGYALPFHNFIIQSVKACSTPEKSNTQELLNCSNISSITHDRRHTNYISESFCSTISNYSNIDAITSKLSTTSKLNVLDRLTFGEAKSAGPFLDGCNIYLAGFVTSVRDRLNKILNVGGATRFDDISGAVTHVIVGDESKAFAELKAIKSEGLCPYILNVEWLEESMKLKRPASEELFLFEAKDAVPKKNIETPASPLSKKNLQMLQQSKRSLPPLNLEKVIPPVNEDEQPDLVQQYLQENNDRSSVRHEFIKPLTPVSKDKDRGNSSKAKNAHTSVLDTTKNVENDNTMLLSQSYTVNEKLFKGLTFVVAGFDSEDNHIEETIVMLGGRLASRTYSGIPDYGIVPVDGSLLKYTVNEIVNDLFIEDCINQEEVVDIMYYHRPLSIRKPCNPLSGCVITMSMYTGSERMYLSTLAMKLGAICQDMFARKANVEKNTHGSTHLVCPSPEGNKYNAAVRWKLPAVTADWLKTCVDELTLVDETPFLVGETIAPVRTTSENLLIAGENRPSPAEEITSRMITPKRHLSQVKDALSVETPLINKRLSLVMNQTPPSPFHVSTPESPYGQVFKPNPSPDTRKGWIKWTENFPDLQVEEPPLKRRPLSTEHESDQSMRHDDDNNSFSEGAEEESNKTTPTLVPSINRKLDFDEKSSPISKEINMQIAQLDQVLQRTSSTPENRYSLSGENAKKYNETSDHIQKCIVKDSQAIDAIVWEDPDHPKRSILDKRSSNDNSNVIHEEHIDEDAIECEPSTTRKFMLSGIKDKIAYEQVIKDLGGDVSTDANFDSSATHLLCIRLSRNEKMLSSIASGKWILHCSYLQDSKREGRFLDEEEYEWGNPKNKNKIPEPNSELENAIGAAVYKWRLKLQKELYGPFSNMVALLMVSEEKYDQFKRLIEAGGGLVMQAKPPYDASPSGRRITHCFVNVKQVNQPVDWAMLASKGILCFLPQYLSDYLTAVTPLNPRECVLPEFKKYLALLPK